MSGRLGIDSWVTKAGSRQAPVGAGSSKGKTAPIIPGLLLLKAARRASLGHPFGTPGKPSTTILIPIWGRGVNPKMYQVGENAMNSCRIHPPPV